MKAKLKERAKNAWFLAQFAGACLVAGIALVALLADDGRLPAAAGPAGAGSAGIASAGNSRLRQTELRPGGDRQPGPQAMPRQRNTGIATGPLASSGSALTPANPKSAPLPATKANPRRRLWKLSKPSAKSHRRAQHHPGRRPRRRHRSRCYPRTRPQPRQSLGKRGTR